MIGRAARRQHQRLAPRRRPEIAAFIRKNADTLVRRIELQVGRDLQYIRINSTLVGGLVGLVIFSVAKWFGAAS
jgi:uncharacterized membrane-anchored protein YjiN (DUF445 family)